MIYREMEEAIWSAEGKAAAFEAVQAGLPTMAKVDPLLRALAMSLVDELAARRHLTRERCASFARRSPQTC